MASDCQENRGPLVQTGQFLPRGSRSEFGDDVHSVTWVDARLEPWGAGARVRGPFAMTASVVAMTPGRALV
jgi:hypothetical protein